MWQIIQSSTGMCCSPPETIAQFRYYWFAELYRFWNYDILAEPSWKSSFSWHIIHDKDLP
jgi:hypothetical protein